MTTQTMGAFAALIPGATFWRGARVMSTDPLKLSRFRACARLDCRTVSAARSLPEITPEVGT
jgi:hypothetical protein